MVYSNDINQRAAMLSLVHALGDIIHFCEAPQKGLNVVGDNIEDNVAEHRYQTQAYLMRIHSRAKQGLNEANLYLH